MYSQLIQTSGGLQKLLAFAAESNIAEVQQHAVRCFAQVLITIKCLGSILMNE